MALTSYSNILETIEDRWDTITEDDLDELADGLMPVYYTEIIQEWQQLPQDYTDRWHDALITGETAITDLMAMDLFYYYVAMLHQAYQEILNQKDGENN